MMTIDGAPQMIDARPMGDAKPWGSPTQVIERERARIELYTRGDVVATIATGQIVEGDARALTQLLDTVRKRTKSVRIFHDWYAVDGYTSGARVFLTRWSIDAPRGTIAECHVLVKSRLVAMGVSTAALALRLANIPLFSYTVRSRFEEARADALSELARSGTEG